MNIRKLLSAYKNKFFRASLRLEQRNLIGKTLIVNKGTIHVKHDKDDAWFFELAKHHDVIFDIGANMGYSAILASIVNPNKKIILVDPNAYALNYAAGNLIRNNLSINKSFICSFIGNKNGEKVKFYTVGAGAAGSMYASHAQSANAVNSWQWVDTMTLDDLVDIANCVPGLVKIDVEAAESAVLQGATKLATLQTVSFFVEMHAPPEMPMVKNASLIIEWCRQNNYIPYYMRDKIVLQNVEMIAERGRCHLLLLPNGIEYPKSLEYISENSPLPISV